MRNLMTKIANIHELTKYGTKNEKKTNFMPIKCKQVLKIGQNRKKSAEKFGGYSESTYLCSVLLK